MNALSAPKTPTRKNRPENAIKTFQLTPIWEEILKYHRLPPGVNEDLIFNEISTRLKDFEWPVRQHAFRVLYDIISVVPKDRIDETIRESNTFNRMIINLGHSAPGIRKVASETLKKYIKLSSHSEKTLDDLLRYGIIEDRLEGCNETDISRENVALGTIVYLPDIIKPIIESSSSLATTLNAVASKLDYTMYRVSCLDTFWKLLSITGKKKFFETLENKALEKKKIKILNVMGLLSSDRTSLNKIFETGKDAGDDNSDNDSAGTFQIANEDNIIEDEGYQQIDIHMARADEVSYIATNSTSDEFSGTDTETYTKESAPLDLHDNGIYEKPLHCYSPSFVKIDSFDKKRTNENHKVILPSTRVLLEAEIQLAENQAINMKVMESKEKLEDDEHWKNNTLKKRIFTSGLEYNFEEGTQRDDWITKIYQNGKKIEEKEKTFRRVRFGGEAVKLRTPDSDITDITLTAPEEKEEDNLKVCSYENKAAEMKLNTLHSTQIPLPVSSVTSRGSTIRQKKNCIPFRESQNTTNTEVLNCTSSSSSSEGEVKENDKKFCLRSDLQLIENTILGNFKQKVCKCL